MLPLRSCCGEGIDMRQRQPQKVHAIEADDSFELYLSRRQQDQKQEEEEDQLHGGSRRLKSEERDHSSSHGEDKYHHLHHHHDTKKRRKKIRSIPRVRHDTDHGMMIDAGSQGTRIHVYEFEARILGHRKQVKHAVEGRRLTFPTTDSRWTDRLKVGTFRNAFLFVAHSLVKCYLVFRMRRPSFTSRSSFAAGP